MGGSGGGSFGFVSLTPRAPIGREEKEKTSHGRQIVVVGFFLVFFSPTLWSFST